MHNIDLFDFSISQNLLTPIILIVSLLLLLLLLFGRKKKDLPIVFLLFSWHTLFSLLYFYFTAGINSVGDSRAYYLNSLSGHNVEFFPGTRFVTFVTYLFTQSFELSYLNVNLIYNTIGALGLILLYLSLKKHLENLPWYWTFILFLPSISYWSSAIGKDSISFTTHGTPLIRYRIGDRIKLASSDKTCKCGSFFPLVEKIEGRSSDYILSPTHGKVNLGNISNSTKNIAGIIQFQVIQKELDRVNVLVVARPDFVAKEQSKFKKALAERFGPQLEICLQVVDEIPKEKSGKFRFVKNSLNI